MTELGMATVCLGGDLGEKLLAIASAGFTVIELFEDDLLQCPGGAREVRKMADDLGLRIAMYQPFREFEAMPEPYRSRAFERAERAFDTMELLGADRLLVCSNVSELALPEPERAACDLFELGERARLRGLSIGYEALAWGRHVNDHRDAWSVVKMTNHRQVGLVLDSFHTLARDIDTRSMRGIPGDRIAFLQIADAPRLALDYLPWSRHRRTLPGDGDFDVTGLVAAVRATGYDGPFSLEIFSDALKERPPMDVARDGYRALAQLMSIQDPRSAGSRYVA